MNSDLREKQIPVRCVIPLSSMFGGDAEDTRLLQVMADGAQNYLRCFKWCKGIRESYFGDGYGGIVAVFLFHIEPALPEVDEWLWVVFGDVPPAHLVTDACKTPSQALLGYIDEMSEWVRHAKQGKSSEDVIPVYIPPTPENATELAQRLELLRSTVVPAFLETEKVQH